MDSDFPMDSSIASSPCLEGGIRVSYITLTKWIPQIGSYNHVLGEIMCPFCYSMYNLSENKPKSRYQSCNRTSLKISWNRRVGRVTAVTNFGYGVTKELSRTPTGWYSMVETILLHHFLINAYGKGYTLRQISQHGSEIRFLSSMDFKQAVQSFWSSQAETNIY